MSNVVQFPRRDMTGLARWPYLVLVHIGGVYTGSISSSQHGFCAVSISRGFCGEYQTFAEAEWAITGHAQQHFSTVTILDEGEQWQGVK